MPDGAVEDDDGEAVDGWDDYGCFVLETALFSEGVDGDTIPAENEPGQFNGFFNPHTAVAEVTFIETKQAFGWCVMKVNGKGIVEIEFYQPKSIVAAGGLPDDIREVRSAERRPINAVWIHHFALFVQYLVTIAV